MRVERLKQDYPVEVEWRPYLLRPDLPAEGISLESIKGRGRYTESYFQQLNQLAEEVGIHMVTRTFLPSSRKALEASEFAKEQGGFDAFHHAVFRAYFEEGRNIGDVAVLAELAQGCALDGQALTQALQQGRYAAAVDEQVAWARRLGISGIPTFIFDGRYALVGAQSYDVFQSLTQRLLDRRRQEAAETDG